MATPARRPASNPPSLFAFPSLFGDEWPSLFSPGWLTTPAPPGAVVAERGEGLRLEEYLEDGTLVIRAEMPGIDPDRDVEITVHEGTLRIRATRRAETTEREKDWFRTEFHYGSFTRVLALPAGASESDVDAHYRDGILEIRVPIGAESAEARKVPIRRPDPADPDSPA